MKFTASALLIGSVLANGYTGYGKGQAYEAATLNRSYATQYKKLDLDLVIKQLNERTEGRIRQVRDETAAALAQFTFFARTAVDETLDAYDSDIAATKDAWTRYIADKRAALADANARMWDLQQAANDEVKATVDALNARHAALIEAVLEADAQYDHVQIVFLLTKDDKTAALTWEETQPEPTETYQTYLSWNARQEGDQTYTTASQVAGYPYGGYGYDNYGDYPQYGY